MNKCFPFTREVPRNKRCLFCFPHSGAGASIFRDWNQSLASNIEVIPVQLPGRETRFKEELCQDIDSLMNHIVVQIKEIAKENQIAYFGHSFGAYLAFESALRVSQPDQITFLSASVPPNSTDRKKIRHLPHREFMDEICRYGGMNKEVTKNRELIELFLPVLRADISLSETYQISKDAKLQGKVVAFSGDRDVVASSHDVMNWKGYTNAMFYHHELEGNHFYHQNNASQLLEKMQIHLTSSDS